MMCKKYRCPTCSTLSTEIEWLAFTGMFYEYDSDVICGDKIYVCPACEYDFYGEDLEEVEGHDCIDYLETISLEEDFDNPLIRAGVVECTICGRQFEVEVETKIIREVK